MTSTSTSIPGFTPAARNITETRVWTALPEGTVPGQPNTVRVSAFVSPQLFFNESVGYRSETSTELSTFPNWVNWPQTVANLPDPITFRVGFTLNGVTTFVNAEPDLSVLQPGYWAAMFGATTTRVDSFGYENFASPTPVSFDVMTAHGNVVGTYNDFAGKSAAANAAASATPSSYTDPSLVSFQVIKSGPNAGLLDASALKASSIPAEFSAGNVIDPPPALQAALAYHAAPANNTSLPTPSVPILDFHGAISSLGHFPELLRYFGLLFPLEVTLPANIAFTNDVFTMVVEPLWHSPSNPEVPAADVLLPTNCQFANTNFLSAPDPSLGVYKPGALDLADSTFSVIDVDVDRAALSLNGLSQNLQSTQQLHAPPGTSPDQAANITLQYALPVLRTSGPAIIWSGFGVSGQGLNALASRQNTISSAIANWLAEDPSSRPLSPSVSLYTDDLTRGWRIDVLDTSIPSEATTWRSLHWRRASYQFGVVGGTQLSLNESTPMEGMVSPAVSHAPTTAATPPTMFVHEMITRWVGWSLSAPRPGGQVNDNGTVSKTPVGNPVVSPSYTDEYGNYNPQISATFATPPTGIDVSDPFTNEYLGRTGLPILRFGHTYHFAARAVDLGGWSLPVGKGVSTPAPGLTHGRWEPVRAPITLPVAPLTAGEGLHTIVIRDDGVTAPTPNARWLFPPRVPEILAEEHGMLDDANGSPDPSLYSLVAGLNDGSAANLPGAIEEASVGTPNLILPTKLPSRLTKTSPLPKGPVVTWLPDPASFGYALYFEPPPGLGQAALNVISSPFTDDTDSFTSFVSDIAGIPDPAPVFTDAWAQSGESWPALKGKLLMIVPQERAEGRQTSQGVYVPELVGNTKITASPDVVAMNITPGSVYQVHLSSIFPPSYVGSSPTDNILGLLPGFLAQIKVGLSPVASIAPALHELHALLEGQIPQLTPYHTLQIVYAVLVPMASPAFSDDVTFVRQPNDITVAITDPHYTVDLPTTATVTYAASWTDPVDNPADPTNDPVTDTVTVNQNSLVLSVADLYTAPIAADPMVPNVPPITAAPFGQVSLRGADLTDQRGELTATHRIGDTKHHLVTYTPTAASRFGQFFTKTTELVFSGTDAQTLDDRGIDVNLVTVKIASSGATVDPGEYVLDTATGTMALVRSKYVLFGKPNPPLSGVPLQVTYAPTDTITSKPYKVHIPATTAPPPIKVARVAPSWRLQSTGTPGTAGYSYKRVGNTLRVYMQRPWNVTGANEMVAVLSPTFDKSKSQPVAVPSDLSIDDLSLLALDPISVAAPGSAYVQAQLSFVTPTSVSPSGGAITDTYALAGGNPVQLPSVLDATGTLYNYWGYEPAYDAISGLWYADIQLQMDSFADNPPPGYFLRLALARFQPYAIGATGLSTPSDNMFLSSTTLVTYAQPVSDRQVTVVNSNGTLDVTVSGPAYYGWRPAPTNPQDTWVHDINNAYARHPNSDGRGNEATSTMMVELQEYNDSSGFSGDFGWKTLANSVYPLSADLDGSTTVSWKSTSANPIKLPPSVSLSTLRLRISELDYFPSASGTPDAIDTSFRRPFVALIPL